ncbi:hypothetical protein LAZ67_4003441 [Cordylochernes scorpioides]|uniref:DUF5641 domain-containing protein n=1 Tax=Cordylochernes scorpioides TaxID=51811 RepID=A0ABY6KEN1_9ARAC|nr:hypothetical protein LAZ67_4003441 [Cordylochernes scorpioides]
MVRTIKEMLIKMLGHRKLKYVQLQTALCEIESIINNRPLTYVSEDDNDLKPLTPNEFLQNGPESRFSEFENLKPEMLHTRYRELGQLKRELKQRFLKEYLGALIQKSENIDRRQLKVGDVVLIGQENLKRMFWPKGRIVNLIPGKDGIVRVAHVKTSTGTLIRALQRLHPLEISSNVKTILMDNSNTEPQSEAFLGIGPILNPGTLEIDMERRQAILQAASCGRKDVKLSCKQRLVDGENALEYPSSSNLRAEKTLRQPTSRDNWTSHKTSQAKPSLRRCCHEKYAECRKQELIQIGWVAEEVGLIASDNGFATSLLKQIKWAKGDCLPEEQPQYSPVVNLELSSQYCADNIVPLDGTPLEEQPQYSPVVNLELSSQYCADNIVPLDGTPLEEQPQYSPVVNLELSSQY